MEKTIMEHFTPEQLKLLGILPSNVDMRYKRISRDSLYMEIAFLIAKRSHDSQTQHGCVAIKDDRVIGAGCNGFPQGMPDEIIPNTRPEKYKFINHAEENLIFHAAKDGINLNNAILYVTGRPCCHCARKLISCGITNWIIGGREHQHDIADSALYNFWVTFGKVNVTIYE